MEKGEKVKIFRFFYFLRCERHIWLTEILHTFLEMGDLVLHEYVIKNGGYYGLMQNELVVKFDIAIFFSFFVKIFKFVTLLQSKFSWLVLKIW